MVTLFCPWRCHEVDLEGYRKRVRREEEKRAAEKEEQRSRKRKEGAERGKKKRREGKEVKDGAE